MFPMQTREQKQKQLEEHKIHRETQISSLFSDQLQYFRVLVHRGNEGMKDFSPFMKVDAAGHIHTNKITLTETNQQVDGIT